MDKQTISINELLEKIEKEKKFNNNSSYYRSDNNKVVVDLYDIRRLFDRNGFVDRLVVDIKTKNGWSLEKLVLLKNDYFVNVENKKIYFDEILDYKIKK